MGLGSYIRATIRNLFQKDQIERDLDDELRAHAEMVADERIAEGMAPSEARRAALTECGGIEGVKQAVREQRAGRFIEDAWEDLRYGARQLRMSPGFAALAILTLAVGIGANTAIFSFINAVLLRPLPYPASDRLAIMWSGLGYANRAPVSSFELFEIRQRTKEFDQLSGIWVTTGAISGEGEAELVKVGVVTSGFLPLLCAKPALGRFFASEDEAPSAPQTIIISHGIWARRFGSDPSIIGRSVRFGTESAMVVGVLPENFRLIFPNDASVPSSVEVFRPIPVGPWDPGGPAFLHLIGRLRRGSNVARAQAEADGIAAQINKLDGRSTASNFCLYVFPFQADVVREIRPTLLLLFGGVALVLLIGCANIANLLLARAKQRLRETTLRAALGASRGRLIRQFLTESLLLGCLGTAVALGIAWAAVRALLAARPPSLANFDDVNLDTRVLAFTVLMSTFTNVLFGLAPAMTVRRLDLMRNLKDAGRGAGWRKGRWTRILVSTEVALAFLLLAGTGLLLRTFMNALRVDPGFRAENVFAFRVTADGYAMLRQLQQNLTALAGVQSAAAVSHLPLEDTGNWYDYYWKEGAPRELQSTVMADHRSILPGYFGTIGATLLKGRDFTEFDDSAHQHVAIIDDVLAKQLWPDGDAIGKKLNVSDSPEGPYQFQRDWVVVTGVVRHVQYQSLTSIPRPQVYLPFQLAPRPTMSIVIRCAGPVPNLEASARKQVALLNKEMVISHVEPLPALVARALSEARYASLVAMLLSTVALLLACIGIYGVSSYFVARCTREIGIRMAIGAPRNHVMRMVLADGLAAVLPGLGAGVLLSFGVTPLLAHLLFGVKPEDPENYAMILVIVLLVSGLAAVLPARRAMNVDPLVALRQE